MGALLAALVHSSSAQSSPALVASLRNAATEVDRLQLLNDSNVCISIFKAFSPTYCFTVFIRFQQPASWKCKRGLGRPYCSSEIRQLSCNCWEKHRYEYVNLTAPYYPRSDNNYFKLSDSLDLADSIFPIPTPAQPKSTSQSIPPSVQACWSKMVLDS